MNQNLPEIPINKAAETPIDQEVRDAVRDILALRDLTKATGTATTRTQNDILRTLSPKALTRVAVILATLQEGAK
jgi:hypothetical protein